MKWHDRRILQRPGFSIEHFNVVRKGIISKHVVKALGILEN